MTSLAFDQVSTSSHATSVRFAVHDRAGTLLTPSLAWSEGSAGVVENWESGPRCTLGIVVPGGSSPFIVPGNEIRPFFGVSLGSGAPETYQLGCYPIEDYEETFGNPAGSQSLSLLDRWKWISDAEFLGPYSSTPGMLITDQIAKLIRTADSRIPTVTVTATSTERMSEVTWDSDRSAAILDLCDAIGAEVFFSRTGVPILQNRPTVGASVFSYTDGEGGTRISWSRSVQSSLVKNVIRFHSTWPDPAVPYFEKTVAITDPFSPVHASRIGTKSLSITDPNVSTLVGAKAASEKRLTKLSMIGVQHSITCIPNVGRQASHTISLVHDNGAVELAQVQTVSHPASPEDAQAITTVSTRSDEDSGL